MIHRKRLVLVMGAAGAIIAASTAVVLSAGAGPATPNTATQSATQPATAFAAMDYYDQSCARCHGPQGSFYGSSLGRDLDDKGLIKVCFDMAQGPAQAPISESDNLTETAFHRSLIMHSPYLSITRIDGAKWSGEVMPDAKIAIAVAGKAIDAEVTDWNWSVVVPTNTKPEDVVITATLAGKTTTIAPATATYSHTVPIPAADKRPKN
jgi:hypothetical protein